MMTPGSRGPLAGLKVVEMAGIGPAPMCGMLLADLGAEIVPIDRPGEADLGIKRPTNTNFILRGRPTARMDLKTPEGRDRALALIARADCLIEGFRPNVMERLGLGPEEAFNRNPALVYGRVTGWGQSGPMSPWAGHDLNYIGLTGALEAIGRPGSPPPPPLNLIGDFGGGALFLAFGLLAGVLEARRTGQGQVVDAAIVDGVASMMTSWNGLLSGGVFTNDRGANILDSGAYFYDVYACADGKFLAVAAIEKRFFGEFLSRLGLRAEDMPMQEDKDRWEEGRSRLRSIFLTEPQSHWVALFANSDACVTPVLSLEDSFNDPHLRARGTYTRVAGHWQAAPAPRFSLSQPPTPPAPDAPLPTPKWAAGLI